MELKAYSLSWKAYEVSKSLFLLNRLDTIIEARIYSHGILAGLFIYTFISDMASLGGVGSYSYWITCVCMGVQLCLYRSAKGLLKIDTNSFIMT